MFWLHLGMYAGAGVVCLLSVLSTIYARRDANGAQHAFDGRQRVAFDDAGI